MLEFCRKKIRNTFEKKKSIEKTFETLKPVKESSAI